MKGKFLANDVDSFLGELKRSDEDRLKDLLEGYAKDHISELLGMYLGDTYEDGREDIKGTVLMTESPIERIFYAALMKSSFDFNLDLTGDEGRLLIPQFEVEHGQGCYLVDFCVNTADFEAERSHNIFIELNGHDYHHSSKEKVTADRKRERFLQKECARMMTFTGSEIYKEPDMCAIEVLQELSKIEEGFI